MITEKHPLRLQVGGTVNPRTGVYIVRPSDDELELLVCGMGIQFAAPAANFALMYLTPGSHFFMSVMQYVGPLCTLGMLGLCFYAVRIPKAARARAREARRLGNAVVNRA